MSERAGGSRAMRTAGAAAVFALAVSACSTTWSTVAMGVYEDWRPYAVLIGGTYEVEIDRPGHIAIIAIDVADPSFLDRFHFTFHPVYPRNEIDSTYFPAGKHKLRPRPMMRGMDRLCRDDETPTVDGCRAYRGGVGRTGGGGGSTYSSRQYVALVSEQRLDPYSIAHYLEEALLFSPELGAALFQRDANTAAEEMAAALVKSPMPSVWAGHYVVEN